MEQEQARHQASSAGENAPLYSDDELTALASELDAVGADATEPWDLLQSLTAAHVGGNGKMERTVLLAICERALAYSFTDVDGRYGALSLGQRFSSAGGDWPPAFDAVDPREKKCWAELADRVTHVLPKAHLTDLALAAGEKSGRAAAEMLVAAYMQLGAVATLDAYYRASCLRRAWTLARQFSLPSESDVRRALYEMARSAAELTDVPPGVLFRSVEPLAVTPRAGQFTRPDKSQVKALVDEIGRRHGQSAIIFEAVHEVREQLADTDDERESARRDLIQAYLDLAEATEGFLRLTWLQQAAGEAQRFGLIDMRGVAVASMQEMSTDDLGLESVSTEFHLPRHAVDERLSRYRWSRGALDALEMWLTTPAPTGSYEANIKQAANVSGRGILQLVSRMTLSPDGMPIRSSVGPESAADEWLDRVENINASTYGIVLANELTAIKTEYGIMPGSDIGAHLANKFGCDVEKAVALGEAIVSYWEGRHTDSARAAYPLVEASARGLLLALGEPLFRIETGNAEGHFPALETYAARLEARGLDIDWLRTIKNPVATLRNSFAHGHKLRATNVDAVILLRTAGLLVLLTPPNSSEVDRDEVGVRLRDPLAFAAQKADLRKRWRRVWTVPKRRRTTD